MSGEHRGGLRGKAGICGDGDTRRSTTEGPEANQLTPADARHSTPCAVYSASHCQHTHPKKDTKKGRNVSEVW